MPFVAFAPPLARAAAVGRGRVARVGAIALILLLVSNLVTPVQAQTSSEARPAQTDVASYRIDAVLDAATHQIRGTETITYRNPSPDTLSEIWLHLYLNAFRSANTQWMREAGTDFRGSRFDPDHPGWIRVESLALPGGASLSLPGGGDTTDTTVRVALPQPLAPGETLTLEARWTSQLPKVLARTGFLDTFNLAGQWYPKLAVYDRGHWDTEPWHANAEFFHDFGTYDLAVTVPAGYLTGASGVPVGEQTNADGTVTRRYHAERVTDVAWTAWDGFQSISRTVSVAGTDVQAELLLPVTQATDANRHFVAIQGALDLYSQWYGTYPWPKLTIVVPPPGAEGAGGMEYPSFVTTAASTHLPLGLTSGFRELEITTVHEIAHQWFPMQVQSNEGLEPWLDEGFADYLTIRSLGRLYGADRSVVDYPFLKLGYDSFQRLNYVPAIRQPLGQPSWLLDQGRYASTIYSKGSLALLSLERTLGEDRFTTAMRAYADRWRWRHPSIADFRASLEESTGENLGWFFDSFVSGTRIAEYQASGVGVQRTGDAPFPVDVAVTLPNGEQQVRRWDATASQFPLSTGAAPNAVAVDPDQRNLLEVDRLDDTQVNAVDPAVPLSAAQRWLVFAQAVLQLLGQVG